MGHIIKKRTKFQKGNFVINRKEFYISSRMHGYYLPSKLYIQFQLPYYYPFKVTVLQKKYYDFMHKKSVLKRIPNCFIPCVMQSVFFYQMFNN